MAGVIGQVLIEGTFYSPWFPAGGDGAEFTFMVMAGTGSLTVEVETKKSEDDDGAAIPLGSASGGVGTPVTFPAGHALGTTGAPGFFDLVRLKYTVSEGSVHMYVNNPSWYRN